MCGTCFGHSMPVLLVKKKLPTDGRFQASASSTVGEGILEDKKERTAVLEEGSEVDCKVF